MTWLLAVIRTATPDPARPGALPEPGSPVPDHPPIRDIQPPVDVFPFTFWQIVAASMFLLLLLGLLAWWLARRAPRRPSVPPPTPRQIALAALARLRGQVETLDAYAFSIEVSSVLRSFVEGQYGLRAVQQTSPEFLAAMANSAAFSHSDRQLLADFLERCDMIKFARVEAGFAASQQLLESATAFVQGGVV